MPEISYDALTMLQQKPEYIEMNCMRCNVPVLHHHWTNLCRDCRENIRDRARSYGGTMHEIRQRFMQDLQVEFNLFYGASKGKTMWEMAKLAHYGLINR